jgi:hypothetical protein
MFCVTVNTEWEEEEPVELPHVEIDERELPEFMGGTWVPPPSQPPSEEELARWDAELAARDQRAVSWGFHQP